MQPRTTPSRIRWRPCGVELIVALTRPSPDALLPTRPNSYQGQMRIIILLVRSLTLAIISQARALSMEASKSLASRRLRLSQAMVRSTTQRRGNRVKPSVPWGRLTISTVHRPSLASAVSSLAPA